jgi:hypothetical protein
MGSGLTKRAPDVWESAAFSSIFLASGFSCSQAESTPAHTQVTQAVRRTSPATAVPAFLPPCYRTGVVAVNGRLTTDQADVMMVVGNGRWARTAYHGVRPH